jgi:hypothetical protein
MFSDSYFLPQFWWIIGNTSGSMVKLEAYSAPGEGACSTYARRFFYFFGGDFFSQPRVLQLRARNSTAVVRTLP